MKSSQKLTEVVRRLRDEKHGEDREKRLRETRMERLAALPGRVSGTIKEEIEEEIEALENKEGNLAPILLKHKRDELIIYDSLTKTPINIATESEYLDVAIANAKKYLDGVDSSDIIAKRSAKEKLKSKIRDFEDRKKALAEHSKSFDKKKIAEVFEKTARMKDPHISKKLAAEIFEKGLTGSVSALRDAIAQSQKVDLCFLMDATESMQAYIALTRAKIKEIIYEVKKTYPSAEFHIAVVAYRDFGDDRQFEVMDFTTNVSDVELFLPSVKATGGGDSPEDVNGGFQKVLTDITWRNQTKVLIHFADAPGHGFCEYPEDDCYPNPPSDLNWSKIFLNIKSLGIDYYFMKIKSLTDLMITRFQAYWKEAGVIESITDKHANPSFSEIDVDDKPTKFVGKIVKPIESSVSKAVSMATSSRSKHMAVTFGKVDKVSRSEEIVMVPLSWTGGMRKLDGVLIQITPKPIDILLTKGFKAVEVKTSLRIASSPFSRGSFNLAYPALMDTEHQMVAKNPIIYNALSDSEVVLELKKKAIAHSLAQDFNSKLPKGFEWARIYFIHSFLFKTKERHYLIEGFMDGKYTKKTNNLSAADETQEIRHLTAFSHYCYEASNGAYMVTDFQGVNFLLTDPAVHSRTLEFLSGGDFGIEGFVAFFSKHVCNDVCRALKLKRPEIPTLPVDPWNERVFSHPSEGPKKCKARICNREVTREEFCKACQSAWGETVTLKCECSRSYSFKMNYHLLFGLEDPMFCETCKPRRLDILG